MNKFTLLFPDFKTKAFTMSFDDGHDTDIPLVELMKKYDLKGSFNLCSGELYPDGAEQQRPKMDQRASSRSDP